MSAVFVGAYSLFAYGLSVVTILYAIGFVGNVVVPRSIDNGPTVPPTEAIIVNLLLLGLFALQHSIMARAGFKQWWTRIVPAPIERSTYVLAATAALALVLWQWRPIVQPVIWSVEHGAGAALLQALFWAGWLILLLSTFLINHFELFGLQQAFVRPVGRAVRVPEFRTPLLYRYVRHPIYLGFLVAFWATSNMTVGHLLFALAMTVYVLIGIAFEERDLIAQHGDRYRRYREQVGMLLPWRRKLP